MEPLWTRLQKQKDIAAQQDADQEDAPHIALAPDALRLYAVTDRAWLGDRTLAACVEQAIAGGATMVQLREKHTDSADVVKLAYTLKPICAKAGVPLIIDDQVYSAATADVDGVHLGQDDLSCEEARRVLGPGKIIGISAQTVDQAKQAQDDGADYLGVGALFATPTKPDAVDVSIQELRAICEAVDIPVVGIGGLTDRTIPLLAGTGVVGAAVVSAIFGADDIVSATRQLRSDIDGAIGPALDDSLQLPDELREHPEAFEE